MRQTLHEEYTPLEIELIEAIYESYNNHLVKNAIFLAERLLAEKTNAETKIILAECYLADAKYYKSSYILKEVNHPSAKYLLAMSFIKQNKFSEAEKALRLSGDLRPGLLSTTSPKNFINGSYGMYLMGMIAEKKDQQDAAISYYEKAFTQNPSLWVAYERLCDLGYKVKESDINTAGYQALRGNPGSAANLKKVSVFEDLVPTSGKKSPVGLVEGGAGMEMELQTSQKKRKRKYGSLVDLIKAFMKAYYEMSNYNIKAATKAFNNMSVKQRSTGWVLSKLGQCYYSIGKYNEAVAKFKEAFNLEPHRLEGVGYYSSCLFHIDNSSKLCDLAFRSFDLNPFSPETWVAMGNCYSKHNDHEAALKFLHRAVEIDPQFSYAYCLRGHEFTYSDMFTDAISSYQEALNVNHKCFLSYWGLGNVYLKQEKYERAINNFMLADRMNPNHPIIKSSIGYTYMHQDKRQDALKYFQDCEKLDPSNLYSQFYKATVLNRMGENERALAILKKVLEKSPKEFQIHMNIGKIYASMGKNMMALKYYNIALDLNPKENQRVKSMIDNLTQRNDFNDGLGYI